MRQAPAVCSLPVLGGSGRHPAHSRAKRHGPESAFRALSALRRLFLAAGWPPMGRSGSVGFRVVALCYWAYVGGLGGGGAGGPRWPSRGLPGGVFAVSRLFLLFERLPRSTRFPPQRTVCEPQRPVNLGCFSIENMTGAASLRTAGVASEHAGSLQVGIA